MGYSRAVRVTGVESGVDGISGPALLSSSPPRSVPSEGDTGRAFYRVTVWVLSWIYNLGEGFMSFSPPATPLFCSPTHHSQPSPRHPCFHSRLHNHCTAHKGLSSQVQPRLARIKERFQLKMFFPFLLSLFFFNQPLPSPFLFSLRFSCHPIPFFFLAYLLHTFHSCFFHTGSFPSPYMSRSLSFFFNGKTSHS